MSKTSGHATRPSSLGDRLDALPESYLREDCECEPWVVEMYAPRGSDLVDPEALSWGGVNAEKGSYQQQGDERA